MAVCDKEDSESLKEILDIKKLILRKVTVDLDVKKNLRKGA